MSPGLERIASALEAIVDADLSALHDAAIQSPQIVPGLLAWLEHAVGWEIDRRAGLVYRLAGPMEAIPPEEVAVSLDALAAIGAAFASGPTGRERTDAILALVDATSDLLRLEIEKDGSTLQ